MEKICIVKLRKKIPGSLDAGNSYGKLCLANGSRNVEGALQAGADENRIGAADVGSVGCDDMENCAEKRVSLTLTEDQSRALRSNPRVLSYLNANAAGASKTSKDRAGIVVIRLEFGPTPPIRLLKVEEVTRMLRISRGHLDRLVRGGMLNSVRIGRLRRFVFDDILSYLERNREVRDVCRKPSKTGRAAERIAPDQGAGKEG